ncbi:hypothetical protein [Rhodococcus gannanensis]|uniref:Uncharacterized protein n=1 Tax=Rhodococcus gannanensis TaxID=1960308 RepID=A0ABW4P3Z4_9NOCA
MAFISLMRMKATFSHINPQATLRIPFRLNVASISLKRMNAAFSQWWWVPDEVKGQRVVGAET